VADAGLAPALGEPVPADEAAVAQSP